MTFRFRVGGDLRGFLGYATEHLVVGTTSCCSLLITLTLHITAAFLWPFLQRVLRSPPPLMPPCIWHTRGRAFNFHLFLRRDVWGEGAGITLCGTRTDLEGGKVAINCMRSVVEAARRRKFKFPCEIFVNYWVRNRCGAAQRYPICPHWVLVRERRERKS